MKKVFIIIAVCIFNFSNILAQQENNKDQWHKNYDHMISNKIAFFTQELDLTPKEAVQYWAVYNQCWDSLMVQGYKVRKALKSLKEAMDDTQKKGDTQIKELMDTYFEACDKEMEAKETMFKELCKVVPVDKAAKTFIAEEKFRVILIKSLRHNKSGQGTGHSKNKDKNPE